MKRCTSCGQVKPETEFWRDIKGGEGRRRARCRECCKKDVRDRSGGEKPADKVCTCCKVRKPLDAFHKHRICLYGVESICKECKFRKRRARNALYPERLRNVELKAKYGITLEDYEAMHTRQGV